jgi:mannose-6-phosphate isomerase-like protein (cupin superfamily)
MPTPKPLFRAEFDDRGASANLPDLGEFTTTKLQSHSDEIAPDGSAVRRLLRLAGGTMARFELRAGATSRAVAHRTVEELWFVLAGRGQLWRKGGTREEVVALEPGVCASLPRGTHFQFRASLTEAVEIVAVTMPPWPGDEEVEFVNGPWPAHAETALTRT